MATETKTFYPGAYASAYSYFTSIENASNPVGKGSSNTTSAYFTTIKTAGVTSYISWPFDVSVIPSKATIDSVSCKAKVQMNMTAKETKVQLYSGNTPKGSSVAPSTTAASVVTPSPGSWTREELSNCMLRISVTVSGAFKLATNFYGADLTVTYTYQSEKFMLKLGGSWEGASRVFKKVSGIWVEQTELANVVEDGVRYKNGGEIESTGPTLITFTIAGTSYQAEEGMTWGEWVASSYNTKGYKVVTMIGYPDVINTSDNKYSVATVAYDYVETSDSITAGFAYVHSD